MNIFYQKDIMKGSNKLNEEESEHCSQVLRHQKNQKIMIYDGNGGKHLSVLHQVSKKKCDFEVIESKYEPNKKFATHLLIAPTKNTDRIEWMIEKLCEVGVDKVTFVQTKYSERKKLRIDRLHKKAISAMKQSKNPFLMKINSLISFWEAVLENKSDHKLIAHVNHSDGYISDHIFPNSEVSILIGPEGGFSLDEVNLAVEKGFKTVSLGRNTLRTETAGFVSCCNINTINQY